MKQDPIIAEARFDPKLKAYMVLNGAWIFLVTIIGIPVLPFWFVFGPLWARRYFERMACILTDRSLIVKKGVMFRTEKTIPLDKIQDFSLKEGPLLRKLGLSQLNIETAGQSAAQGAAEAGLIGVIDVFGFRDQVLQQRDHVASQGREPRSLPAAAEAAEVPHLLEEIRDSLHRIEQQLGRQ